jgi:hypothetical protein
MKFLKIKLVYKLVNKLNFDGLNTTAFKSTHYINDFFNHLVNCLLTCIILSVKFL